MPELSHNTVSTFLPKRVLPTLKQQSEASKALVSDTAQQ